ncbi:tyrosine-protein phosphatase non-receptor type substrate 1-like isoform X1 [Scyliorhinus canicula]|uniref:tyrosine-protein phosphatase non-receptor type substrate 1-like isoform X1 n=1 Tax=Scyliorhinus canicula TaxID=7830 RepID=UPI0018F5C159|nr:tyrosine-protein phosphatase non-receptor type substrate 1-like isoform X1 [Scyliorhinus canicula]
MSVLNVQWCFSVLGIVYGATGGTSLSVRQIPTLESPVKGANVSMYCSIPLFDHNTLVDVYWRRDSKEGTLQLSSDKRNIMIPFRQGSAELHLLNVSFQDSGVYYCSVRVFSKKVSSENGTELIVQVPPTPVKITLVPSHSLTLLCTTAGFFPEEFDLIWYRNNIIITSGMSTRELKNEEGLYQVSSSLTQLETNSFYSCGVSHSSLETPAYGNYTVRSRGNIHDKYLYLLVSGCLAGGLITVLLVILIMRWRSAKTEGSTITANFQDQFAEQIVRGEQMSYVALNYSEVGKSVMPRRAIEPAHVQTRKCPDVKLTYAAVDFTDSQKRTKREQKIGDSFWKENEASDQTVCQQTSFPLFGNFKRTLAATATTQHGLQWSHHRK